MTDRATTFPKLAEQHDRIVITGPPNSGKTTLSGLVSDRPVIHMDDLVPIRRQVELGLEGVGRLERYVLEGCGVPDCLALGLEPDLVVWLDEPFIAPGRLQRRFGERVAAKFWAWAHHQPRGLVVELP